MFPRIIRRNVLVPSPSARFDRAPGVQRHGGIAHRPRNHPPTPQSPGDIDTLLKEGTGAPFPERPVLLQQVQYACRDASGKIEVDANGAYACKPGEVGGIESYDQFGPGSWPESGRYTSVNGEVLPLFPGAQAGRIERWRIAHAGVRDSVKLQFKKMRPGVVYGQLADAKAQQDWVAANCLGDPLPQFAIASDGLTRRKIAQLQTTALQPGYREDLLMVFPEAGDYCVVDDQAPANANINADVKSRKLLGSVNVGVGNSPGSDLRAFVTAQLLAAADRNVPVASRQKVRDDLSNDLRLTSFAPHPDVSDDEIKGHHQAADLRIGGTGFGVNGVPYDPAAAPRVLVLGSADEWTLTAGVPGHPFHIHVNPFQIMEIRNPSNIDVSVDRSGRSSIRESEGRVARHAVRQSRLHHRHAIELPPICGRLRAPLPHSGPRGPRNDAERPRGDSGWSGWSRDESPLSPPDYPDGMVVVPRLEAQRPHQALRSAPRRRRHTRPALPRGRAADRRPSSPNACGTVSTSSARCRTSPTTNGSRAKRNSRLACAAAREPTVVGPRSTAPPLFIAAAAQCAGLLWLSAGGLVETRSTNR